MIRYSVVIPTLGRPCLTECLKALAVSHGPGPERIVVVDDRPTAGPPLEIPDALAGRAEVVAAGGRGPAAARNLGWRHTRTPWVAFLDDDVRVTPGWREELIRDLAGLSPCVGGTQGMISVPLPEDRRPTDWERGTAGLADAQWITADMAYRRDLLVECGGFDERFPRAFREDADLALRALRDGWLLEKGRRRTLHPVRLASAWVSVRTQAGNADDALMRRLHGPGWQAEAGERPGRLARHVAITGAAVAAVGCAVAGKWRWAATAAIGAAAGVTEFAAARILPGPWTRREIGVMAVTSLVIPPLAVWHRISGTWKSRAAQPWPGVPQAILFDRDGTLVLDVPYNGDPEKVELMPGAREAVGLALRRGLRVGVVSNQSGIARGLITAAQAQVVNERVDELTGPFGTWQVCPHDDKDGCGCRKPADGLVTAAARALGVEPRACVVIGDIGSDVAAAHTAGARAILVPTVETEPDELTGARVAPDLLSAVRLALGDGDGAALWP